MHAHSPLAALTAILLSVACGGTPSGGACEVTGDGFSRRDPCQHTCVDWEIECADGRSEVPGRCSAGSCTDGEACAEGFHCLAVGVAERECLPVEVCAAAIP